MISPGRPNPNLSASAAVLILVDSGSTPALMMSFFSFSPKKNTPATIVLVCKACLCWKFTPVHQCPSGSDKAGTILMIQLSVPLINAGCRFCPLRRQDADTSDRLVPCGFLDERWQRARVKKREASGREKKKKPRRAPWGQVGGCPGPGRLRRPLWPGAVPATPLPAFPSACVWLGVKKF